MSTTKIRELPIELARGGLLYFPRKWDRTRIGRSKAADLQSYKPVPLLPHSCRNAISGSTRRVRRAGIYDAAIAISASTKATTAKVAGSAALTEYSSFAIKRVNPREAALPIT